MTTDSSAMLFSRAIIWANILALSVHIKGIIHDDGGTTLGKFPTLQKSGDIMLAFKREMAILNTFDTWYNYALKYRKYLLLVEPRGSDYAIYSLDFFVYDNKPDSNIGETKPNYTPDPNVYAVEENELRDHFNYFMSTDFIALNKEAIFANMYATYLGFWATMNLRICSMYYNPVNYGNDSMKDRANKCQILYRHMHWFTFIKMEKKVYDFQRHLKRASLANKLGGPVLRLFNNKAFPNQLLAETIWKNLYTLDLDFLLDNDYYKMNMSHSTRGMYSSGIVDDNAVYKMTSYQKPNKPTRLPTIYNLGCIMNFESKGETDEERRAYFYTSAYDQMTSVITNEIFPIEDYFTMVKTGEAHKTTNIKDFIPDYPLSLKIWDSVDELLDIKNMDNVASRPIHGTSSDSLRRSNAIEVLRKILQIRTEYQIETFIEQEERTHGWKQLLQEYKMHKSFVLTEADLKKNTDFLMTI